MLKGEWVYLFNLYIYIFHYFKHYLPTDPICPAISIAQTESVDGALSTPKFLCILSLYIIIVRRGANNN